MSAARSECDEPRGGTMAAPAVTPMRASDQERHEAILALSEHYAQGRLDLDEFQARMERAQSATYLHELDPLFADLPTRRTPPPRAELRAAHPRWADPGWAARRPPRLLFALIPALLITAIVLGLVHGHPQALFWLIPLGFFLRHRAYRHHYPVPVHPRLPR